MNNGYIICVTFKFMFFSQVYGFGSRKDTMNNGGENSRKPNWVLQIRTTNQGSYICVNYLNSQVETYMFILYIRNKQKKTPWEQNIMKRS